MTVSKTKPRATSSAKKEAATPSMPPKTHRWKDAWNHYRLLLAVGLAYVLAVTAESVYCGVPLGQFMKVGYAIVLVLVKCIMLLLVLAIGIFVRGLWSPEAKGMGVGARILFAHRRMADVARDYLDGEVFACGVVGVLALFANDFFFIQKSLIRRVHAYTWDPQLADWDKVFGGGHFPHEWVIPFSDALGLGRVYDVAYYLWFVVMYVALSCNLFVDTDIRRRLRFLWVFLLSWIALGSVCATALASVGPLFYHTFYPDLPDVYKDLTRNFNVAGPGNFPIAWHSRDLLIGWTKSPDLINLNALSAMPSMHIAIAWLTVLYSRSVGRGWFIAALVFCALIFLGTIYFGFHYAVDSYTSIAFVSVAWWIAGRLLSCRYPDGAPPLTRV